MFMVTMNNGVDLLQCIIYMCTIYNCFSKLW